ncbi:MAG: GMC family oxidoreductase [Caldilineaceae bacterium]
MQITRRHFLMGALSVATSGALVTQFGAKKLFSYVKPEPRRISLEAFDAKLFYDVCIIGSGPAGATLGQHLVNQGLRTVILESGFFLAKDQIDPRLHQMEMYRSVGPVDYPLISTRVRAIGGTSNIWTGRCARLHPIDFEPNAYTPAGADWPFRYAELEPYYAEAERTLRVRGAKLSAFQAPRHNDLPLQSNVDDSEARTLMEQIGITVDQPPTSTGNWGGPIRAAVDLLPNFTDSHLATLVSGATATRLHVEADGSISGVTIQHLNGAAKIVRAATVVVACGAVESARLLQLSTSPNHPQGIGNHHDLVGRFFGEHPHLHWVGAIPHRPSKRQMVRTHQFYDQFKKEGLGALTLVFDWRDDEKENLRIATTTEMRPQFTNRVMLSPELPDYFGNPGVDLWLDFAEEDLATFQRATEVVETIYAELGATDVHRDRESWGHHHVGTCRMGHNPETSVLDANLRVHESPNLYVLSSAAFVTGGAGHPTVAIVALSHRLAEHLTGG